MSSFYYRLREYRINTLGLSQKEMDLRLHRGQSGISKLEAGKMKIDADDLVLGKEAGKEYSPIVLRERFDDAEIMTILEMCEKEPELKNVLRHLTLMPEKDRKRVIQHIINFINVEKTLILAGPLVGLEAF